jgi:small-conductance mechanosensitive channel
MSDISIPSTLPVQLIKAIVVVVILMVLMRLALAGTRRALARTQANPSDQLLLSRVIEFTFIAIGALMVLAFLGVEIGSLAALVGIVGLTVSLAFQDLLRNIVAGVSILIERPFTIGQHIDFRTFTGTVETTGLRTTVLRTTSGTRAVIPNALLLAEPLVNRSAYGNHLVRLRVSVKSPGGDAADADTPADGAAAAPARGGPATPAARAASAAPAAPPDAKPARQLADELLGVVTSAAGVDGERSAVLVESLAGQKVSLRAEFWAEDKNAAAAHVAWAVRERLPAAEITVLE